MKWHSILHTNWMATFRLNYHAGGWKAVWHMPVRVYGSLRLTLRGKILLPHDAGKNMLVIQSDHEDYTASSGRAELNILGTWKLNGSLRIGPDSCIAIDKGALLETGADTYLGRDTQIHCYHHISIGNRVFAGEMYVCDSTVHRILLDGSPKPLNGEVFIGDGAYLGFRTILLKGTVIPPESVVGSGSVCTSDYTEGGAGKLLICGNPAVVKTQAVTSKF